ncbi:hypothetical protein OROHE_007869 [Orobanche hederae]
MVMAKSILDTAAMAQAEIDRTKHELLNTQKALQPTERELLQARA